MPTTTRLELLQTAADRGATAWLIEKENKPMDRQTRSVVVPPLFWNLRGLGSAHTAAEGHQSGHRSSHYLEPRDAVVFVDLDEVDAAQRRRDDLRLEDEAIKRHFSARCVRKKMSVSELIARNRTARMRGTNRGPGTTTGGPEA